MTDRLKNRLPPHAYRAYRRLRLLAAYEAVLRAFWPLVTTVILFLGLSIWGLWQVSGLYLHIAGLVLFTALIGYFLYQGIRRVRIPGRGEVLARLEHTSQLDDAEIRALADSLPEGATPEEISLWKVWQERLKSRLGPVRSGWPVIGLAHRDPFAFRFIPALILASGLVLFADQLPQRIESAFTLKFGPAAPLDVTAWIEPPQYTGRTVFYLSETDEMREVPVGSKLTVQVNGSSRVSLGVLDGGVESLAEPTPSSSGTAQSFSVDLQENIEAITLMERSQPLKSWQMNIVPDMPPVITLRNEPGFTASGAMLLNYEMMDDYGVTSARAIYQSPESDMAHVLIAPPSYNLVLPAGGIGASRTYRDLSTSPWAGEQLELRLIAEDAIGQEGRSRIELVQLPERRFTNPFAIEIVALRQQMALDRREETEVLTRLLYVLNVMANEEVRSTPFMALNQAFWRLRFARNDEARISALDMMWQVALDLEGDMGALAAEALRRAQEELRDALRDNASPEEIAEKMDNLRRAIAEYLAQMSPQILSPSEMMSMPMMEMRDISQMLNDMQNLAETGARAEAEALLNSLENILENLQMMQAMGQMQPNPLAELMQELQQIMRTQQQLRDQTYSQDQLRGEQPQRGQQGSGETPDAEALQRALEELAEQQGDLAELLRQIMQDMGMNPDQGQNGDGQQGAEGQNGQGQNGQGQPSGDGRSVAERLADALRQMMDAQGQLGTGEAQGAGQSQEGAVQALREAGQALLDEMAQQQQGQGGQGMSFMPNGQQPGGRDPLGRSNGGDNSSGGVEIPTETEAQRVRDLLFQLRERLSAPGLEGQDADYIQRLLRF